MLFLETCPSKLSCRCRGCCARMHHAYVSSSSPDRVISCYELRTQHSVLSCDNQQHVNMEAWLLQPRDEEPSSIYVLHGRSSSLWWLSWQDCMSLPLTSRGNERFTGISCNSAAAILNFVVGDWEGPGPPSTSGYADGHRVKIYVSITHTEGVMPILMISRSRGRHIGLIFFFNIDKEPGPPNISD